LLGGACCPRSGSARQAIRYLYKAGEFAALNDEPQVCEEHVRKAEDHVEQMNIAQSIRDLTIQDQLALRTHFVGNRE